MTVNELSGYIKALQEQGFDSVEVVTETYSDGFSIYEAISCCKFIKDSSYEDWQGKKVNADVVLINVS